MKSCPQTEGQSVYEHCISVRDHLSDLLDFLQGKELKFSWRLPNWLIENRDLINSKLLPRHILEEYAAWHDCGKPFCRLIDAEGKQHFPKHAETSERIWLETGGDPQIGRLIGMDMDIHLLKATQVPEFAARPEALSLLLTGLSEVHANAKMFGGIESTSFKIKYGQIDKRGRAIMAFRG